MSIFIIDRMKNLFIILFIIIVFSFIFFILLKNIAKQSIVNNKNNKTTCNFKLCKNLDPVSDPIYNMQQIVKQSILLEEHLANKSKRCRDCITKHFLHIIGLAEEAQMLATDKIENYPLINECVILYNKLFKEWLKDTSNINIILHLTNELRTMRKKLIAIYFFNDEYSLKDEEK